MSAQQELTTLCYQGLKKINKHKDILFQNRLLSELKEINTQDEQDYFLSLYKEKKKYANENNLLVPYLLGICSDFDIEKQPEYEWGEFPDIDVDFLPAVRNYLKETYTPQHFGEDYVCNIATYSKFGLRSSLLDMARIFSLDHTEINTLTKRLGIKDDEGETLTWGKALELYDELREYCEQHPEMADAAKRMLHRNHHIGVHASGLIISSVPIHEFVPLVKPKGASQPASAWVQGLHGTDLDTVGLVKFDFLSLEGNMKIARACKMIDDNNHIIDDTCKMITTPVSALPGKGNWSDISYLNDPEALKMANKGDLKMIFQFDGSEGIRNLAKRGGVDRFDDLVAYTALYRPGPMKNFKKIHVFPGSIIPTDKIPSETIGYLDKDGKVQYTKKFSIEKIKEDVVYKITTTSGHIVYTTEDFHDVLVTDFTNKKWIKGEVENKELLSSQSFSRISIKEIFLDEIHHYVIETTLPSLADSYIARKRGEEEYTVHPVLKNFMSSTYNCLVYQEQVMRMLNIVGKIPLKDCESVRKAISKKKVDKFRDYREKFIENGQKVLGKTKEEITDLWNYIEAFSGYAFNLSHSVAYTYISSRMLYLKCHYPKEFYCSVLRYTKTAGPKDYQKIKEYKREAEKHKVTIRKLDINKSKYNFSIINNEIYYGFRNIKTIGVEASKKIAKLQPYKNYEDFLHKFGTDAKVNRALISLRVFPENPLHLYQFYEEYKKKKNNEKQRETQYHKRMKLHKQKIEELQKNPTPENIKKMIQIEKKIEKPMLKKPLPQWADFKPKDNYQINKKVLEFLENHHKAEEYYYGFVWNHPLENCQHFENNIIDKHLLSGNKIGPVDVLIKTVEKKQGPKVSYYSILAEDAVGETARITCWASDFNKFKDLLKPDAMVRLSVQPPSNGYKTFTMAPAPRSSIDVRVLSLG